jgi:hypothetical protein
MALLTRTQLVWQNNADEGPTFVPQNITTETDFLSYLETLLPLMDAESLALVESEYAIPPTVQVPLFSTLGDSGPTALNQSEFGIGQQQRANNLYAETTFVCPSYWLATAYSAKKRGKGWKYQYSVPPSEHGADLDAYYAANREALGYGTLSTAFREGVQLIWGRFIIGGDPRLPESVTKNLTTFTNGTETGDDLSAGGNWPAWKVTGQNPDARYRMLNLNMTGGHEVEVAQAYGDGTKQNLTQYAGPGLMADWAVVDAYAWEGGRGKRCDFWANIGAFVPE